MQQRTMGLARSVRLAFAAGAIALMPGVVHALGLGQLTVYSALNERLEAEIRFTSVNERELKTLTATLGTPSDFHAAGIAPPPLFSAINIELVRYADGRYALALWSKYRMREPFLRILLQVEWAGGHLIREFTALIDPANLNANDSSETPRTVQRPASGIPTPAARETIVARRQLSSTAKWQTEGIDSETASVSTRRAAEQSATSAGGKKTTSSKPPVVGSAPPSKKATKDVTASSTRPAKTSHKEKALAERIRVLESQIKTLGDLLKLKAKTLVQARGSEQPDRSRPADVGSPEVKPRGQSETPSASQSPAHARLESQPKAHTRKQASPPTVPQAVAGWFGKTDLSMVVVALASGLFLIAGGFVVFIYMRRESEAFAGRSERTSHEQIPEPVLEDRRTGRGRRQRFVPVPFERRRGPRRSRDHLAGEVGDMETEKVDTVEETETYLACGHHEHAEKALKDAIAGDPDRHALKVKLLALYQQRDDPRAFENLANDLYAALEIGEPFDEQEAAETAAGRSAGELRDDGVRKRDPEDGMSDHSLAPLDKETDLHESDVDEVGPSWFGSNDNENNEPIAEQEIEFLDADVSHDQHPVLEQDLEALEMHVPKAEGESTQQITSDDELANDNKVSDSDDDQKSPDPVVKAPDVDDFVDIRQAVERGMEALESRGSPDHKKPPDRIERKNKAVQKPRSRSRKRKRKAKGDDAGCEDAKQEQWRKPASKIDLAKAYIDMGDAERARHLLDEVLENWDQGDGTRG
ncbi:MAG: FimV/HubP family polar landmark protein [Acidiferrobacterales bacterium]